MWTEGARARIGLFGRGRIWRRQAIILLIVSVALAASGCGGGETEPVQTQAAAPRLVSVVAFAAEVSGGRRFVLNVHTPDEGSIDGTTAAIPFDQLEARADELPDDRGTPLAVYCRTGRMSQIAVVTLAGMGYLDVVELSGGMQAWTASGRSLAPTKTGSTADPTPAAPT